MGYYIDAVVLEVKVRDLSSGDLSLVHLKFNNWIKNKLESLPETIF